MAALSIWTTVDNARWFVAAFGALLAAALACAAAADRSRS